MRIVVLGIDLGKTSCSLVGLDENGAVVLRRRLRRSTVERFVGGLEPCVVAMEACCGAHHLGRVFGGQGHEVRLMSPEYVRAYVKAQKNDDRDAAAIDAGKTRVRANVVPVDQGRRLDGLDGGFGVEYDLLAEGVNRDIGRILAAASEVCLKTRFSTVGAHQDLIALFDLSILRSG